MRRLGMSWRVKCLTLVVLLTCMTLSAWVVASVPSDSLTLDALDLEWVYDGNRTLAWTVDAMPVPLTTRSLLTLHPETIASLEAMYLSVWSSAADPDGPPLFELVWEKAPSSWVVSWNLKLRRADPGSDPSSTRVAEHTLARALPQVGHTYEALASYDPSLQTVALSVTDMTTGKVLYQGQMDVAPHLEEVQIGAGFVQIPPVAGTGEGPHPVVTIDELAATPYYLPVDLAWDVGVEDAVTSLFISSWRFEPQDQITVVIKDSPRPEGVSENRRGSYQVFYKNEASRLHLATLPYHMGEQRFTIAAADLPWGQGELQLSYVHDQTVRFTETKPVSIGHIDAMMIRSTLKRTGNQLEGRVYLSAKNPYPTLPIELLATFYELTWDPIGKEYVRTLRYSDTLFAADIDISDTLGVEIPVVIELPSEPGLWALEFEVQAPVDVSLHESGPSRLYATAESTALESPATHKTVRVCTYNVYGFQGWPEEAARVDLGQSGGDTHIDHFTQALGALDCDILGVQEGDRPGILDQLARNLGMEVAKFYTPTAYPAATFSRFPIIETHDFSLRLPGNHVPYSRAAGAILIDLHGIPTWVVNIHAHPTQEELRAMEATILAQRIDELAEISPFIIVLGDFNSPVGTPLHTVLRDRGFLNTMSLAGGGVQPTMTTRDGVGTISIDHIYVSMPLVGRVKESHVVSGPEYRLTSGAPAGAWVTSDHLPVVADIEWP